MNIDLVKVLQWYKIMECDYIYDEGLYGKKLSNTQWEDNKVDFNMGNKKDAVKKVTANSEIRVNQRKTNTIYDEKTQAAIDKSRELADKATALHELRQFVSSFDLCDLRHGAKSTVFSDGSPDASIVAVGEAPGANEDIQGIPFCGESGKLLDKMFASIDLVREKNIYITNTVFWRPPNNRRPTKEELDICRPFVEKHIAIIKPKLLILVGATALEALLDVDIPITKARQQFFEYKNRYMENYIPATPIFHPAYLLRQQNQKKLAWEDLLNIKAWLENHQ